MRPLRLAGVAAVVVAAATGCGRDPASARDAHLASGDALFRDSHFPQATVEYQKAVTADPQSADARQRLAESYIRIGMVEFAVKEYARAATLAPARADLQLQAATLLLAASRFGEAEAFARRGVALDSRSGAAHMLLGNAIAGLSSVTDARSMVSLNPASPGAADRFREAEAEYRLAMTLEPDGILPRIALGWLLDAQGRGAEAEAEFRRAASINPADVIPRRALAQLYLAANRHTDAEVELRALADAQRTPAGYLELADYYMAQGRWADARPILESLLDRVTTFSAARIQLAAVEFQSGNLARAHALADEVLNQFPNDVKALLLKARLLRVAGRVDDAIVRARSAMDADPDSVVARRELASLYVMRHNRDEALRVLAGLTSASETAEIQIDIARLHLQRGDPARARAAADRAMAAGTESPAAKAVLARVLVSTGDLTGAEAALRSIPAGGDGSADVLTARGDLEAARGHAASARRAYRHALVLEPDDADALTAAVRLAIGERRLAEARAQLSSSRAGRRPAGAVPLRRRLGAIVAAAAGDQTGAEAVLRALVAEDPADAESWLALAELRQRAGRLPEAEAAAAEAVHQQPAWPRATLTLGDILEARGQIVEAHRRYEQLLKMDPDATDVRTRLGR